MTKAIKLGGCLSEKIINKVTKTSSCAVHSSLCHPHIHQISPASPAQIFRFSQHTNQLTFSSMFSKSNKERCIVHLSNTKPVRPLQWQKEGIRTGAVLVPLCTINGEPSLLFTLRSNKLLSYRGQVSFPGGKADDSDEGHVHTALREAEEEVGINPADVQVWGEMQAVPGRNYDMAVTPVLAYCGEIDIGKLNINNDEVEEVFTQSIRSLCHPSHTFYTSFANGYTLPVFIGGAHRIWGLTGIITHQVLNSLAPGLFTHSFKQHRRL